MRAPNRHRRNVRPHAALEPIESRVLLTAPTLAVLPNVTLPAGAPMQIPLDGFDADGDTLTYSVSTSNPSLVGTLSATTNRSLKISVSHTSSGATDPAFTGDMVLSLFEDKAPKTTARIIQLVNSGFYNNLIFHRVIPDFVIQGGDPLGTGTGGSGVQFDDEFDPTLRFTGPGLLAMAKSSDDTNDSQFFITENLPRYLDFQHSIFGQLVEGDAIREKISNVPRDANDKPLGAVKMTAVSVFADKQNRVLQLSIPYGFTGSATVTVTANDGKGGTASRTFTVNVVADTTNDPPYLLPIADVSARAGQTTTTTLHGNDVEGNAIGYLKAADPAGLSTTLDFATGVATITPSATAGGVYTFFVGAVPANYTDFTYLDTQAVPVFVSPAAPTGIDLVSASDTGTSTTDNRTRLNNANASSKLTFQINGVLPGAVVRLFDGATQLGQATVAAGATSVSITTSGTSALSNGTHNLTATQALENLAYQVGNKSGTTTLTSLASSAQAIVIDTTGPTQSAAAAFNYLVTPQSITYAFSEDVGASLAAADLKVTNLTTGTDVPAANLKVTYPSPTQAVLTFPGYTGGALPDGNYKVTITTGTVTDVAGNALPADNGVSFFVMAGDTDHNRTVDFNDLVALAQNYNTSGKTFKQGDFNYDGTVDFNDLVLLAQRYNTTLSAAPAAPLAAASPADVAAVLAAFPAPDKSNKAIFSTAPVTKPAPAKPKPPARPVAHR